MMNMKHAPALAIAAALTLSCASGALAQPSAGETAFKQRCAVCHALQPAPGKLGPVLKGVVGRKAATVPGYAYSPALKAKKITWTPAQLDTWLKGPQKVAPGTKMVIAVPDAALRKSIIAYLATQK